MTVSYTEPVMLQYYKLITSIPPYKPYKTDTQTNFISGHRIQDAYTNPAEEDGVATTCYAFYCLQLSSALDVHTSYTLSQKPCILQVFS